MLCKKEDSGKLSAAQKIDTYKGITQAFLTIDITSDLWFSFISFEEINIKLVDFKFNL